MLRDRVDAPLRVTLLGGINPLRRRVRGGIAAAHALYRGCGRNSGVVAVLRAHARLHIAQGSVKDADAPDRSAAYLVTAHRLHRERLMARLAVGIPEVIAKWRQTFGV